MTFAEWQNHTQAEAGSLQVKPSRQKQAADDAKYLSRSKEAIVLESEDASPGPFGGTNHVPSATASVPNKSFRAFHTTFKALNDSGLRLIEGPDASSQIRQDHKVKYDSENDLAYQPRDLPQLLPYR